MAGEWWVFYRDSFASCGSWEGQKEITELLIDKGADVNAKTESGWHSFALRRLVTGRKEIHRTTYRTTRWQDG